MTAREVPQRRAGWTAVLVVGACLVALAPRGALADPAPKTPAQAPKAARNAVAPQLAVLVGKPGERTSALHLVRCGGGTAPLVLGPAIAELPHLPLATYTAAAVGADVVVVVDEGAHGDRSFASALLRLRPGEAPQRLASGLAHASRPVALAFPKEASPKEAVTSTGNAREVVVSRGTIATGAGGARADQLTLEAVDVRTGAARTLYRATGNALYVVGTVGDEIVFDRIDEKGDGALLAVHKKTLATRVIAPRLSPFARDFAIDEAGRSVVFTDRHEADRARFVVDRIDLANGKRDRLHEDTSATLAPQIWPDGSLALTRDPDKPLERFDLGRGVRTALAQGLPRGIGRLSGVDPTGSVVAVTTSEGGGLPIVSVVDGATGKTATLPLGAGLRATVAGFVPGGSR